MKTTLNLNNFELEKINFHQMMKTVNRIPIFIILNETISDFFSAWLKNLKCSEFAFILPESSRLSDISIWVSEFGFRASNRNEWKRKEGLIAISFTFA